MSQLFDTRLPGVVGYAQVALEQGIDLGPAGLTYAVPEALAGLRVGERVIVPLGRHDKPVPGFVVERSDSTEQSRVKAILQRDAQSVSLTPDLVELARWISNYYCCPLGMVFVSMLPAAVKRGTGRVTQVLVGLPSEVPAEGRCTPLQRAVLDAARARRDAGTPFTEIRELADLAGAKTISPIRQLIDRAQLVTHEGQAVRADWGDDTDAASEAETPGDWSLTTSQSCAIERLADHVHAGFSVHLLHGVTGSGKTEVYLRVIEHVLGAGSGPVAQSPGGQAEEEASRDDASSPSSSSPPGAIVLVPEIALTPQTVRRFTARFPGGSVAVLHSGLTPAQRHDQWRRIRGGQARIVVGARSAVFAPLPGVRVIIVDEEHDSSYKQDQLPRYHARDVAIKRAQLLGVPVVLGSATPSLESYYNATHRKTYHLLELPARVAGLKLPTVQLVDMRLERRKRYEMTGSAGVHLLSIALESRLRQTLESGGQAMLLLNRRGYANYIACPDHACGWMMGCEQCDATMVFHKDQRLPEAQGGGFVRCHHCLTEQMLPAVCPQCGKKVTVFGLGTQRVEEELARKFPDIATLRMDSDTMRSARDYHQSLEAFRRGEVRVLLGTQMIAKGLDFPNVRLVGVISGDTSLHMPDFRAAERTFQLIAQVAGRSGRGEHPGLVIVQTFSPEDPAIVLAAQHDYPTFADNEIKLREAVGLPPKTRMARIVVRDKDYVACREEATKLAAAVAGANAALGNAVRIKGPAPCPVARVANFHRIQIELIAPDAAVLQKLLTTLRNAKALISDASMAVDVDPVALL